MRSAKGALRGVLQKARSRARNMTRQFWATVVPSHGGLSVIRSRAPLAHHGCLALCVVEVRWHRDDGVGHAFPQEALGGLLHLEENHRADLLGGERLCGFADSNLPRQR